MLNALLQIRNLKKNYYNNRGELVKEALKGISLDIYKGEVFGLLGVNGAGKTTLSSVIATLHPPTSGDILWNNRSIYSCLTDYRSIIGFCPQKANLNPLLTLEDNLLFDGSYYQLPEDYIKERAAYLMEKFKLTEYAKSLASVLSGGYKQRFLIARALMHDPKIIILDEPTVALDPHIRHQLWDIIKELKKEGITIILTTHYIDEAEILSDRVCILDQGLIKLIDNPENLKASFKKGRLEDVFLQLMHEDTSVVTE